MVKRKVVQNPNSFDDVDISVNNRYRKSRKSQSDDYYDDSVDESIMEDLAKSNESRSFSSSLFSSFSGSPFNSVIKIPDKVSSVLSFYDSDNKFQALVSFILDSAIDSVYDSAFKYILPALINQSLSSHNLSAVQFLKLPPVDEFSRADYHLKSVMKMYSQYHEWLFSDIYRVSDLNPDLHVSASSLLAQLHNLSLKVDEYKASLVSMNDYNSQLKGKVSRLENQVKQYESTITSRDDSISRLELELFMFKSDFSAYKSQYPEHKDRDSFFKKIHKNVKRPKR